MIYLSWNFALNDIKDRNMTFKNEIHNWDDFRLFLAVSQEGSLAAAASVTGSSAPTLSRRMRHLEDVIGLQLFERTPAGYLLTSQGRDLLGRVQEMAGQSQGIQAWRAQLDQRPVVRVTAGFWTSVFLSRHLSSFASGPAAPRIELLTGANFLNLTRREADIAMRNKAPEQGELKRKRIGQVSFDIYGAPEYCAANPSAFTDERYADCDWIVPSKSGGTGTSSFWIRQRIGATAKLVCDTPQAVLEAACAGGGLCILPRFIGANEPRLRACSKAITSIDHTQWLVMHQDGSATPHIRKVFRRIAQLFDAHKASFH